jgi:hypothetical protein
MSPFWRRLVFVGANLLLFVALRHAAVLLGFLGGMGAADHYRHERWLYAPGTVLHLLLLGGLHARARRRPAAYPYGLALLGVVLLAVLCALRVIPAQFIPS